MIHALRAAALSLLVLSAAGPAFAGGPQIPDPRTRLLVGAAPAAGEPWRLGLELVLEPGWHTYWRNPGDSGVPPVLDPAGSGNLAAFAVGFPAPERWSDGFGTSLVYHDRVVLPLTVAAADPQAPVALTLGFDFGVCREICVPARADLAATLDPGADADPDAAAAVAAAFATLPVPEAAAGADAPRIAALTRTGEDRKGHVDVTVATAGDPEAVDLFVEGPERWYLSPPERLAPEAGAARFRIALDGMPKAAHPAGARLVFTLTDGTRAVEAVRTLD